MTQRLLVADRVIDGSGVDPIVDAGVLLDGASIVDAGPAAQLRRPGLGEEVYAGSTILPGLIDSHVHLELSAGPDHTATRAAFHADREAGRLAERIRRNARAALLAGVTTVRDCGSTLNVLSVRDAIVAGEVGPRILAAGPPITRRRGHCHWWGGEADTEAEVLAAVRARADAGTHIVKIMMTGGIMTPESDPYRLQYSPAVLRAAVRAAHHAGVRVVVHALAAAAVDAADDADVDSIDHAGWAAPDGTPALDHRVVARIGRNRRAVGLTASGVVRAHLDTGPQGDHALRELMFNKVALAAAGARIHIHSDAGVRFTPFDRPDLSLRAAAIGTGMRTVEAIAAMTGVAADVLGLGDVVGRIRPGLRADLLVVDGDPSVDLGVVRRVRAVWRDGVRVAAVGASARA